MKDIYSVIKGPCLTEKSSLMQEVNGQVALKVDPSANKPEIKAAVEKFFNVKVADVKTANVRGKKKRVGRFTGYTSGWKKAVITLKEGSINILEDL
jgi:large subunit ribosomal protein L23